MLGLVGRQLLEIREQLGKSRAWAVSCLATLVVVVLWGLGVTVNAVLVAQAATSGAAAPGGGWVGAVALVLVAVLVLIYVLATKTDPGMDDGAAMSPRARRVLVAYLLLVGLLLIHAIVALASVDFPAVAVPQMYLTRPAPADAPMPPPPAPTPTPEASPRVGEAPAAGASTPPKSEATDPAECPQEAAASPVLLEVLSQWQTGRTPIAYLAIYGDHFARQSRIHINGVPQPKTECLSERLVRAPLEAADLLGIEPLTVEVRNGNRSSGSATYLMTRPRMPMKVLGMEWLITREVQLLLLALCAGALGSFIHALKSLADFIGNRTAVGSWFWWYISRPFVGAAISLMFYAVLRGGFLAGTPADANIVNPFGVIAVSTLVGMFSDKAAQKLGEIFETLFRADDRRSGKLTAPFVESLSPPSFKVKATDLALVIKGDRLGTVSSVRLNAAERKPDSVSNDELKVTLLPKDVEKPAEIKVTAVNPDGGTSPAVTLRVVEDDSTGGGGGAGGQQPAPGPRPGAPGAPAPPAAPGGQRPEPLTITTTALPEAAAGKPYEYTLAASGGTGPYQWSLVRGPDGLKLDADGRLTGTPLSPGALTVTVTDAGKATARKALDLAFR